MKTLSLVLIGLFVFDEMGHAYNYFFVHHRDPRFGLRMIPYQFLYGGADHARPAQTFWLVLNLRCRGMEAGLLTKATEFTMVGPLPSLSTRTVSLVALLLWAPVVASFRFAPGTRWPGYVGIFYHLAVFLLVFKLPAPEWARAAGYGWLFLDVAAGVFRINQAQPAIAQQIRLGGHIFAGIWIVVVSLQGSLTVKLVGLPAGAILFAYTFASPFLPTVWLSPAAILVSVWLAILAWQNGI